MKELLTYIVQSLVEKSPLQIFRTAFVKALRNHFLPV